MAEHDEEGRGARLVKLGGEPGELLGLLGRGEGEVGAGGGLRHVDVAVERDDFHQRVGAGPVEGVPERGLGPAGAGLAGVGELHLGLGDICGQALVVVVAHDGVSRAGEGAGGVHVLKLALPARVVDALGHGAVPAVAEQDEGFGMDGVGGGVADHLGGGPGLAGEVAVPAPVADEEEVVGGGVGRGGKRGQAVEAGGEGAEGETLLEKAAAVEKVCHVALRRRGKRERFRVHRKFKVALRWAARVNTPAARRIAGGRWLLRHGRAAGRVRRASSCAAWYRASACGSCR